MHPYVILPLLACVGASSLASAVVVRGPRSRPSWLAATALACVAAWSLLMTLAAIAPDAASALFWMRCYGGAYLLAPICLHLVCERSEVRSGRRWTVVLAGAYAIAVLLAVCHAATSSFVAGAQRVEWGFAPVLGPASPLANMYAAGCVVLALISLLLERRAAGRPPGDLLIGAAVGLPLIFVLAMELPLRLGGGTQPPMTSALIVLTVAALWTASLRVIAPALTPSGFAREILDTLPDGVALLRVDGRVRAANRSLSQLVGRDPGDLIGAPAASIVPDSAGTLDLSAGEREVTILGPDGRVPASASLWPIADRQGAVFGYVLVVRDEREIVDLRHQLVTSGRLAAVGELAAGIAHEVNNPLAFIQANLNLLYRHYGEVEAHLEKKAKAPLETAPIREGRHLIGECLHGIARVGAIVREVRSFSHHGIGRWELTDVNELLESALRLAMPQLRHSAQVERSYADLPATLCAAQDLKQVFLSLILNAAQALEGLGAITLTTERAGDELIVCVRDDGRGIEPDVLGGLFGRTGSSTGTHDDSETGTGLSIARRIVAEHGGELVVESERGRGTVASVHLPLVDEAA